MRKRSRYNDFGKKRQFAKSISNTSSDNNRGRLVHRPLIIRLGGTVLFGYLKKAYRKMLSFFYICIEDRILFISLAQKADRQPVAGASFRRRVLTPADRELLARRIGNIRAQRFMERMKTAICYAAIDDNYTLAGYVWCTECCREQEGERPFLYAIKPRAGLVYLFDIFVFADCRNRGAVSVLLAEIVRDYTKKGKNGLFLLTDAGNAFMHAAAKRVGFGSVGRIRYRRLFWNIKRDTSDLAHVNALE